MIDFGGTPLEDAGVERRLAAILAADVVGYSRLMAADEAGTHARLKALRKQFIEPTLAAHHGRTVKLMGDGTLVEFASVVDAVQCAVEIQRAMAERETAVADDRRIRFRVGVNLGDVIIEDDDIYGDGVNIAARLEGLAEPGGIVISGTAFDHARNKAQAGFRFLGRQQVKNIPEPVRAYRVLLDPAAVGTVIEDEVPPAPTRWRWPAIAASAVAVIAMIIGLFGWRWLWGEPPSLANFGLPKSDELSIAVLPFENMSGSAEQEYFSDGISEDIITDLSKISNLLVIARNSSFKFKGQSVDLRQVAGDLGVRYVLEGSVRRAGDQLRISAQLIDGSTGAHLWAERYDRPLDNVFAVQDEITRQIVQALHLELTQAERDRVMRRYTDDVQAYDDYLLARSLRADLTKERSEESRRLLEDAIARDPKFAAAYAELSWAHHQAWENGWSGEASRDLALELAQQAVALDESLPEGHARLAWAHLWRRQYDDAIAEGRRAIAIDPNYADGYLLLSHILIYAGEAEEGVEIAIQGMPLDPDSMYHTLMHLADGQRLLGRNEEAIENFKRSIELRPNFIPGYVWLASICGNLGRQEEAEAAAAQVLLLNPNFSISAYGAKVPYRDEAVLEQFREGLRAAGLPEDPQPSVRR
ncbi:MAG TPA: tetratricopeptide repeat protein [Geminicoccaceae bacterium]|nr:tetratricopeptide repeat protein [Geminicoccaceae bacterium]